MEILRLAGGPGVGKSAVAWTVWQRLRDEGVRAGYVDIDQLGMCYPAPADDPERWALKERVLERVAGGFAARGMPLFVVSGVAETRTPPPAHGYRATSIWLDAAESVRRARLAARDWTEPQVAQALSAGTEESAHAHADWIRMPTDDLTTDEVADRVLEAVHSRIVPGASSPQDAAAVSQAEGSVLWITGPRFAGASTIGWQLVSERWTAGIRTGFADAAQLAFAPDAAASALALAGVVSLHEEFVEVGADSLVVVAPEAIAPADVVAAFPHADVVVLRIGADEVSRRARAQDRRAGRGPLLAGDDVAGASDAEIDALLATGGRVVGAASGDLIVDTSGLDVSASTAVVRTALAAHAPRVRPPRRS